MIVSLFSLLYRMISYMKEATPLKGVDLVKRGEFYGVFRLALFTRHGRAS